LEVDLGYLLIMSSAVGVGAVVRRWVGPTLPLPSLSRLAIVLGAIIGGALGAKIPWLFMDPEGMVDGTAWLSDGRTITFGLVGGYFGVEVAKLAAGVKTKTGDSFAVPLAASIAVGRLGCFWAGCCFGIETALPWAVDFGDGVSRHPTQLYEAAFHAAAALILYELGRRRLFERQRIKLYFIAYFAYRFVTEWIRPEPELGLGLTLYQWSSLAFIVLFVALFRLDRGVASEPAATSSVSAGASR
jgi:phosphatidylglycerol:prolipoprotein diacylglycerol transferase